MRLPPLGPLSRRSLQPERCAQLGRAILAALLDANPTRSTRGGPGVAPRSVWTSDCGPSMGTASMRLVTSRPTMALL